MFHRNIRLPGVYIFNNNSGAQGMQSAPIFSTMSDMSILGMNNADDYVLVFPKYKVIFDPGAGEKIIDNTTGTKCKYEAGSNGASSCQVFYNNEEIVNVFSITGS
jgi:hypothetical protein